MFAWAARARFALPGTSSVAACSLIAAPPLFLLLQPIAASCALAGLNLLALMAADAAPRAATAGFSWCAAALRNQWTRSGLPPADALSLLRAAANLSAEGNAELSESDTAAMLSASWDERNAFPPLPNFEQRVACQWMAFVSKLRSACLLKKFGRLPDSFRPATRSGRFEADEDLRTLLAATESGAPPKRNIL